MSGRAPASQQAMSTDAPDPMAGAGDASESAGLPGVRVVQDPAAIQLRLDGAMTVQSIKNLLKNQGSTEQFFGGDGEPVSEPMDNDVLCGRGGLANNHVGNKWFRELVRCNRELYHRSKKQQKMMVSKAIVAAITSQQPPGRFLELSCKDKRWYPVEYKRAVNKTSQTLREKPIDPPGAATPASGEIERKASLLSNIGALSKTMDGIKKTSGLGLLNDPSSKPALNFPANVGVSIKRKYPAGQEEEVRPQEPAKKRPMSSPSDEDPESLPLNEQPSASPSLVQFLHDTVSFISGKKNPSISAAKQQNQGEGAEARRRELVKRQRELQQEQIRQMDVLRRRHVAQQQRLLQLAGMAPGMLPFQTIIPAHQFPPASILPLNGSPTIRPPPLGMPSGAAAHSATPKPILSRGSPPSLLQTRGPHASATTKPPTMATRSRSQLLEEHNEPEDGPVPMLPFLVRPSGGPFAMPPQPDDKPPEEDTPDFPLAVVEVPGASAEESVTASATTMEDTPDADPEGPPRTRLTSQVSDWLQSFFPLPTEGGAPDVSAMDEAYRLEVVVGDKKPPASHAADEVGGSADGVGLADGTATDGEDEIPPPLPLARSVSSALLALATSPSRFLSGLTALWDRTPSGGEPEGDEDEAIFPPNLTFGTSLGSLSMPPSLGQTEVVAVPPQAQGHLSWGTRMRGREKQHSLLDDVEESEDEQRFRSLQAPSDA